MDSFGCQLGNLAGDQALTGGYIDFYRKSAAAAPPSTVATPASGRGYLVGLSLSAGHQRRIWKEHHSTAYDFDANSLYVRRFADPYKAQLAGSFDFILMEISTPALEKIADGADAHRMTELSETVGEPDPLAAGLVRSLFSMIALRGQPNRLLVDQLSTAIGVHLVHRYGNGAIRTGNKRQRLSAAQESRAKELLRSAPDGDLSVEYLAAATGSSAGQFLKSFRESTGMAPDRWLTMQRVEQAIDLLKASRLTLNEISSTCGFSTLSEFRRVFKTATGVDPGTWRQTRNS